MALQTDVSVKIGGLRIKTFIDFELNQRIDGHHELTIECREEEIYLQDPGLKSNYHQLIGETILVTMQGIDRMFSSHTGHFKGVVTRVKALNINDSSGKRLQFRAYSCISRNGNKATKKAYGHWNMTCPGCNKNWNCEPTTKER